MKLQSEHRFDQRELRTIFVFAVELLPSLPAPWTSRYILIGPSALTHLLWKTISEPQTAFLPRLKSVLAVLAPHRHNTALKATIKLQPRTTRESHQLHSNRWLRRHWNPWNSPSKCAHSKMIRLPLPVASMLLVSEKKSSTKWLLSSAFITHNLSETATPPCSKWKDKWNNKRKKSQQTTRFIIKSPPPSFLWASSV